jgi:hypothetical protein
MKAKNVITWKDADQNLCHIAAMILRDAMRELRQGHQEGLRPPMTRGKGPIPRDYAYSEDRSWMSFNGITDLTELADDAGIFDKLDDWWDKNVWLLVGTHSTQCWWSFQNIVRFRLREARESLWENCYGANKRKSKKRTIHSRNRSKRKQDTRRER